MIYYDNQPVAEMGEDWVILRDGTRISGIRDRGLLTDDGEGGEVYAVKVAGILFDLL